MTRRELLKFIASPETLSSETTSAIKELTVKYPFFSIAQILYLKNLHNINDEAFEAQLQLTAAYTTDRGKLKELLFEDQKAVERKENSTPGDDSKKSKTSNKELIDKFIKAEPKISQANKNKETDIEIPDPDEEEIYNVATETLAKIYLKQGDKSRTIKIYKQLILKIPEKSSYFAAQIEKIKKEDTNI